MWQILLVLNHVVLNHFARSLMPYFELDAHVIGYNCRSRAGRQGRGVLVPPSFVDSNTKLGG